MPTAAEATTSNAGFHRPNTPFFTGLAGSAPIDAGPSRSAQSSAREAGSRTAPDALSSIDCRSCAEIACRLVRAVSNRACRRSASVAAAEAAA